MAIPKWSQWLATDKLVLLQGWARDGLSDEQIAHNMGISRRTFYYWKKIPECEPIFTAVKNGKVVVDYIVENALMKSAINGNVVAQIFWLKNRKPDQWRDRVVQEVHDDMLDNAESILINIKKASENEKEEIVEGEATEKEPEITEEIVETDE